MVSLAVRVAADLERRLTVDLDLASGELEIEAPLALHTGASLAERGHAVRSVPRIAGGMNAISVDDDGMTTGAACWRADGTPVARSGGLAQAGTGFSTS